MPVPPLRARVNDLADAIPPAAEARLEEKLARLEAETSHQIAVLTVPTLAGEPIESFALRVAEAWQLGQKGVDNGILVAVAVQDRGARIEVGYGLEGVVPDVIAKRTLEDVMFPRFRSGDFAGGIEAGVDALIAAARGEVVDLPPARPGAPHEDPSSLVTFAIILATVLAAPLASWRPFGPVLGGLIAAGVAWLFPGDLRHAALAFAIAFALLWLLPSVLQRSRGRGRGGRGRPVFVPRGGGFGGRGGGFGGGGGRFGGGGASGRW
jgi:uncharacterized protein